MEKVTLELQNALDKELSMMKNDFYYQQIDIDRADVKKIVRIDTVFKPLDILGGDSYSVRKTNDGKITFFILDAMGKGVSASITAATSTSLLNYIFDQMKRQDDFDFDRWIQRYIDFVKHELLDNEMLAVFFGCYDKKRGMFKHASFGMPASLIETDDGEFIKTKSNNAPISQYTDDFVAGYADVKSFKKALFYTDGLCESLLENGAFYRETMYKDFLDSKNFVDFSQRVNANLKTKDDDILLLYIDTLAYNGSFIERKVKPNVEDINNIICEIGEYARQNNARPKEMSELSLALSELTMNALEHGVFGIDKAEKNRLIEEGTFDELLQQLQTEHKDRTITIKYIVKQEGNSKIFIARIEDGGNGFDTKTLRKLVISPQNFNGRGIMIIKKLLDRFYYNEKGNIITIRKFLN